MSWLRLGTRLVAMGFLCTVGYASILAWNLVAWAFRFSPTRGRLRLFRRWSRLMLRVLGARVETRGIAPSPPFLLVSNHLGYVDIAVLAAQAGAVFVARADLAGWPVFGTLSRSVGTLFVDRGAKRDVVRVAAAMEQMLQEGVGLVLFPEGTSSDGERVLPFRPSLLEPAARMGIPVYWAALAYRTPEGQTPAGRSVCWWDDMEFLPHLMRLMRLSGFEARVVFGETPVASADRKSLAEDLHAMVRQGKEAAAW